VTEDQVVDIICDICEKSCKVPIGHASKGKDYNFEYSTLGADWGYGSYHDGDWWHFDFCIDCSEKLWKRIEEKSI
jgi:hypothetical protein